MKLPEFVAKEKMTLEAKNFLRLSLEDFCGQVSVLGWLLDCLLMLL